METISSIQEADTSVIDRLEADLAKQRQDTVDAANIATKRAALFKTGLGIGAAATGIGLGGLLILFGTSLIVGRPTHEEVVQALQAQAATIERFSNEKIEAIRSQAATTEREAGEKKAQADQAIAQARKVTEKFISASGKTVVDFDIFRTQEVDGIGVVTGWKYKRTDDPAPSQQWCYIEKLSEPNGLHLPVATDGHADRFNPEKAAKAGITWNDVQKALPYCDWFKGTNTNIQDSSAHRL